jgi:hypothetical protein
MEIEELQRKLETWKTAWPKLTYSALQSGASLVQEEIKRRWSGDVLNVKSGKLRNAVLTKVSLNPLHAKVYVEAKQQYKAQTFEQGRVIRPGTWKGQRNGPFLQIKPPKGYWGRPREVTITARPVFKPSLEMHRQNVVLLILHKIMEGYRSA